MEIRMSAQSLQLQKQFLKQVFFITTIHYKQGDNATKLQRFTGSDRELQDFSRNQGNRKQEINLYCSKGRG